MAAIIRVKRRNSIEPQDALVISCKKRKIENEDIDSVPLTTVMKFAGTVKSQEENVVEHISKHLSKEQLEQSFKKHSVDILTKMRNITRQNSIENRYKIINYHRSLAEENESSKENITTVIDVEDYEKSEKSECRESVDYVYDLYYTEAENKIAVEDLISVHPVDYELVFENQNLSDQHIVVESSDSNSESNWRNDYPEESDHDDSIDEDDMKLAIENLAIDDLSSEEDFVYSLDEDDVQNYGYSYAKYKAKLKEEDCNDSENIEYEDNYEYSDKSSTSDDDQDSNSDSEIE